MMQKKIEIVIESSIAYKVIRIMDRLQAPGYTMIANVTGRGRHDRHDGQELTDLLQNSYVFTICSPAKAEEITQQLAPLLKKYGGISFMTEVALLNIT